jgi:hypothetical protein
MHSVQYSIINIVVYVLECRWGLDWYHIYLDYLIQLSCDYTLHFTVTHTLVSRVISSLPLLGNGFQVSSGGCYPSSVILNCPRTSATATPTKVPNSWAPAVHKFTNQLLGLIPRLAAISHELPDLTAISILVKWLGSPCDSCPIAHAAPSLRPAYPEQVPDKVPSCSSVRFSFSFLVWDKLSESVRCSHIPSCHAVYSPFFHLGGCRLIHNA